MSKLIGKINLFIRNGQITFPSLIHLAMFVFIVFVCLTHVLLQTTAFVLVLLVVRLFLYSIDFHHAEMCVLSGKWS